MAVNAENYKDIRQKKNMIALAGISIDNMKVFKNMGIDDLILRKLSERLVLSLRKTFTVASGLKYQFWVLIPNVDNMETLMWKSSALRRLLTSRWPTILPNTILTPASA